MNEVGALIKKFRGTRNVTQKEVHLRAEQAGYRLSISLLSQVERGKRNLTKSALTSLNAALALTAAEITELEATRGGRTFGFADVMAELAELRRGQQEIVDLLRPRDGRR